MISKKEESKDDMFWSILFVLFFNVLLVAAIFLLYRKGINTYQLNWFEVSIIALAVFRLTRLVVYDSIAQFVRDIAIDKNKVKDKKTGLYIVTREKPKSGFRRKLYELMACPWCFGVWAALFVTFFFYYTYFAWFVIVFLAIAGLSTLVQLIANYIGWMAEGKKIEVQRKQ